MSQLVSLHHQHHQHLRVNTQLAESQGAHLHMVPVMLSEFLKLAVSFPIAITKQKETGQFVCVALFGFESGENLFFSQGQWDSLYIPLQIARQPFFLGENNQSQTDDDRYLICIDTANPAVQPHDGEALFDIHGQSTGYLENIKAILAQLVQGESAIQPFCEHLMRMQLLQPMQFEITFANGESTTVEGLYTINEQRLQQLSGEELAHLQQQGWLAPLYSMVVSLGHIYRMVDKKNQRLAQTALQ